MTTYKPILLLVSLFCFISLKNAELPNNLNLYIGDFNGDGRDDYLRQQKGRWDDDNRNTAKIYFSRPSSFRSITLPESYDLKGDDVNLYIGDFDGDGRADILRQDKGQGDAFVLLSRRNGNFEKVVLPEDFDLRGDLTQLYIGDFNGDGRDDILRQEKGAWDNDRVNTAYLLLATGGGNFRKVVLSEDYDLKGDLTNLYIGDFDGDGRYDILRQEKGAWDNDRVNTAYLLLSNGDGTFQKIVLPEDLALKGDLTNLYVGDFNGDGLDDVLRQEKGAWDNDNVNTAYLLISTGDGFTKYVLSEDYLLAGDYTNLYIGDFNGDGKADILRQEKGDWDNDNFNTANILFATTPGVFRKVVLSERLGLKGDNARLYIGDFNNDGRSDYLKYYGNDRVAVYLSNGNGNFRRKY